LVARIACTWPSVRSQLKLVFLLKKCVFLLNTIPRFLGFTLLKNWGSKVSEVSVVRNQLLESSVFPHETLTKDQNVISSSEWIREVSNRFDNDFRVFCDGLIRRRTVIIPLGKFRQIVDFAWECPAFRTKPHGSINPNVFSDDLAFLVKIRKVVKSSLSNC
jgi:hypothetical protein